MILITKKQVYAFLKHQRIQNYHYTNMYVIKKAVNLFKY